MSNITVDYDPVAAVSEVSERWRQHLENRPAKALAREFRVEIRTAEGWKAGTLPQNRHLVAMASVWGVGFLEFIFAPVLAETDLDVTRRLKRAEAELASINLELARRAGGHEASGLSDCGAADGAARGARRLTVAEVARRWSASATIVLCLATMVAGLLVPDPADARPLRSSRYRPGVSRVTRARGEG